MKAFFLSGHCGTSKACTVNPKHRCTLVCFNGRSIFVPSKNNVVLADNCAGEKKHSAESAGPSPGLSLGSLSVNYNVLQCRQCRGATRCEDEVQPRGWGNSKGFGSVSIGNTLSVLVGTEMGTLEIQGSVRILAKPTGWDSFCALAEKHLVGTLCRPRGANFLQNQMSDKRTRLQVREGADPPLDSLFPSGWALFGVFALPLRVETIKTEMTVSSVESEDMSKKKNPTSKPFFCGLKVNV